MPLFLVTYVCDEGVYYSSFRVVEASSRLAIAEDMIIRPSYWKNYLRHGYNQKGNMQDLEEYILHNPNLEVEELLEEIDNTYVDGDSFFNCEFLKSKI
jgi:hypothetical protein